MAVQRAKRAVQDGGGQGDAGSGEGDVRRLLEAIAVGNFEAASALLTRRPELAGVRDSRGRTMLMTTVMFPANKRNGWAITRLLLDMGVEVNVRDRLGRSALAYVEDAVLARMLLDRGADVHARDRKGDTVLMHAVMTKNAALVRQLLERGADVNAVAEDGQTALILCVRRWPDLFVVRELIAAGADVDVVDDEGETALSIVRGALGEIDSDEQELIDEHELILEALKRASKKVPRGRVYNSLNTGTAKVGANTEFIDKNVLAYESPAERVGKKFFYNTGNVDRDGVVIRAFNANVLEEMQKTGRVAMNPFTRAPWPLLDAQAVRGVLKKVPEGNDGGGSGGRARGAGLGRGCGERRKGREEKRVNF